MTKNLTARKSGGSPAADRGIFKGLTAVYEEILRLWAAGKLSHWQVNVCYLEMAFIKQCYGHCGGFPKQDADIANWQMEPEISDQPSRNPN